ncbi:MAG: hypothetical protein NTV34_14855 [Proteobacteria bacterium]|nr:hypothetical protein [Pseudomonadota bacterium]
MFNLFYKPTRQSQQGSTILIVLGGIAVIAVLTPLYLNSMSARLESTARQKMEEDYQQLRRSMHTLYDCKKTLSPLPAACRTVNGVIAAPAAIPLLDSTGVMTLSSLEADPLNLMGRYRVLAECSLQKVGTVLHSKLALKAKCVGTADSPCKDPGTGKPMDWKTLEIITDCVLPWKDNAPVLPPAGGA